MFIYLISSKDSVDYDSYDAHIMYLTMSTEIGTATGTIPVTAPDTWIDTDHVDAPDAPGASQQRLHEDVGEVLDEAALIATLEQNRISGAALASIGVPWCSATQ